MPFGRKSSKPRAFLNEGGLYEYGVRSLGRQMRSEAELRRLMQKRVEPGERGDAAIAAALARLREHGYLDDVAFVETYARLRQQNEKLGERRVRQDLKQKGVHGDLIRAALRDS
jgi:regulatory protein